MFSHIISIVLASYSLSLTNRFAVSSVNEVFKYNILHTSDGFLVGDGVCHLASFMNLVAQQAGLETYVPKNHDFAIIPDVPKKFGVSIFADPVTGVGQMNNLYITNNKPYSIKFEFTGSDDTLALKISQLPR